MAVPAYIVTASAAYLLGSIPTGFLVAKARGIDIRTVGSGNIGATNAFRILGRTAGLFVLLVDALKGWLAVEVITRVVTHFLPGEAPVINLRIAAGVAVILGHNFTCWLNFKGGKGIATTAGVLVALVPWALLILFVVWVVTFLLTRYVSVASIAAALALPPSTWFTAGRDLGLTAVAVALSALAIYKHRGNIQRLWSGTEHRIEFKRKGATT